MVTYTPLQADSLTDLASKAFEQYQRPHTHLSSSDQKAKLSLPSKPDRQFVVDITYSMDPVRWMFQELLNLPRGDPLKSAAIFWQDGPISRDMTFTNKHFGKGAYDVSISESSSEETMNQALKSLEDHYFGKFKIRTERARVEVRLYTDMVSNALKYLPEDGLTGIELVTDRLTGSLKYDGDGIMRLVINALTGDEVEDLYSNVDKILEKLQIQIADFLFYHVPIPC